MSHAAYRQRITAVLAELGIAPEHFAHRPLRLVAEAQRLTPVGLGTDGRDKLLTAAAARAWLEMRNAAATDGVELLLISAFRSVDYQAALLRAKLAKGVPAEDVLRINAPPGYSEHHSGRAVDIGSAGTPALDEAFERTDAFDWLRQHAGQHGFRMSFPRGNRQGYLYEPWHWCWSGAQPPLARP